MIRSTAAYRNGTPVASPRWAVALPLLALLLWFLPPVAPARAADPAPAAKRHILVLNSYHKGYEWTDNEEQAIEDAFRDDRDVILSIEFMDTKMVNTPEHFALLFELYRNKYRTTAFDVVIATDDDALRFLRQYHAELFPGVPVVFCGIANYGPAKVAGLAAATGVTEATDFHANFELIARLQPQAETLYVISDQLTAGRMIRQEFAAAAEAYADRWRFVYLTDNRMAEVLATVRGLDRRAAVFYLSFFQDATGETFDPWEAIPLISEAAPVPVYGQVDYMIGKGIVGGMVKSSYYQGKVAAQITRRILAGEPAESIPVVMESPNAFMFDYLQLERHHIPLAELPADAVIVNEPETFYYRYKHLIWGVAGTFAALLLFIVVLLLNIQKRKRAQRGLQDILEAVSTVFEQGSLEKIKAELGRVIRRVIFLDRAIDRSLVFNYGGDYGGTPGSFEPGALVPVSDDAGLDDHTGTLIRRSIEQSACLVEGRECVALFKNPAIPGNVVYMRGDRHFDGIDRDLLEILTNNVSMAIEALEKSKIQESLETARGIQQSMLPRNFEVARKGYGIELFAQLLAAKEVGGDLYDFFSVDEERFCFVVGDVSDKGVPAALFMAMAKTLIRSAAEHDPAPEQILAKANNELARDNDQAMFVTLFLAIFDRRSGVLSYANGGHNAPFVVGAAGEVRKLPLPEGIALGVFEDVEFHREQIRLAPGDGLMIYTDGVTEAMSVTNEEFGEERLVRVLAGHRDATAQELVAATLAAVQEFAAGANQSDDITLMFLRPGGDA